MLEHPDITNAMRTGYPSWQQPEIPRCERCENEIHGEVYEDRLHDYLCEECLLELHKKGW